MATKKILLRGISRTPSDRMSADGGLAESIGFETDMQELATAVPAKDVTSQLGLNAHVYGQKDIVFIHKTNDYANYIAKTNVSVGLFDSTSPYYHAFYTFQSGEVFQDIKSVGNTLILLTNQRMEYILYKNGEYVDLGDEIPEPRINCYTHHANLIQGQRKDNDGSIVAPAYQQTTPASFYYNYLNIMRVIGGTQYSGQYPGDTIGEPYFLLARRNHPEDDINYTDGETTYNADVTSKAALKSLRKGIYNYWMGLVNAKVEENAVYNFLSWPRFVRYAVRLYDGTYVRHSAPIMICCPDSSYPKNAAEMKYQIMYRGSHESETWNNFHVGIKSDKLYDAYYADFSVDSSNKELFGDWSDIISSVDMFMSEDIIPFSPNEGAITDSQGTNISEEHSYYSYRYRSNFKSHSMTDEEELDRILSKSIFYRVKELSVNDYTQPVCEFSTKDFSFIHGDRLVVKPTLPDDTAQTNKRMTPLGIKVYNERLLAIGANIRQYDGYYEMPSRITKDNTNAHTVTLRYFIKKSSGEENVVQKQYNLSADKELGNWLYYPDPRCYKVLVGAVGNTGVYFDMKEHPYLNGAYCMTTFENRTLVGIGTSVTIPSLPDANTELRENTLFQYGVSNMFKTEQERSFPYGRLIDLAVITKPLSTGQYGYSSLYIFTDQGLFSVATNKDGSMGQVDTVSQDVALPGTVCQLDQAVVFTTKKGVMLLTGSDIKCISEHMHGRHYMLDASIYTLLRSGAYLADWGDLASIAYEDEAFMTYMADARTVYDYVGRRLLFFSVAEHPQPYIYTYMIETDSWHKIVLPANYTFRWMLNSYPDALISADYYVNNALDPVHYETRILSFSNARGQNATTRHKGMIVTRPMDFDEDDVRKVLNRLYVRGLYDRDHVKIIIMASMDGLNWMNLSSLRGGSYKLFRLVLLADLTEVERISYVEAEYETRFGQRLR